VELSTIPNKSTGRFVQHVLPKGFVKVRYYGLFRNGNRRVLEQVRDWLAPLAQTEPSCAPTLAASRPSLPSAPAVLRCPACGQSMQLVQTLVRQSRAPPAWP
jgi:hypothetical protein